MNEWLLVVGMAIVTFAVRYPPLVLVGRVALPRAVLRALRYVPVAVLTAIIVPAVLLPEGAFTPISPHALASVVAGIVAWRTRQLLPTITAGMGLFLLLRMLANGA